MNPDRYTKTVLTIIAICLLIITGKSIGLVTTATAADMDRPAFATVPLNEDGSMNVRVVGMPDETEVYITGCSPTIDVKVKNWP